MSILSQITIGKKYTINGVEIEFKSPHINQDIEKLLEGKKEDISTHEQMELMKKLVRNMVKDSIPDATEEELNDCLRLKTLLSLIDIFYEVSGMTDEENLAKAEKIKSALEQRREAIERARQGTRPTT